jgi:hypothetical protein
VAAAPAALRAEVEQVEAAGVVVGEEEPVEAVAVEAAEEAEVVEEAAAPLARPT